MAITQEDILRALSRVDDPDIKKDLVTLNMVKDIRIEGDKVFFTIVLTTPACPLKEKIKQDCINAIHEEIGNEYRLFPEMTADVSTLRKTEPLVPGVKNIIAISSGKGGVGKSTVTSNLAIALAQTGASVGIIDADISGPSVPIMFKAQSARPGLMEKDGESKILPVEQYGVKLLSIGFLAPPDNAVIWRGPMASTALKQFFSDAEWGELDYLLIDLPPGTSDIHLTLTQTVPLTGAVVVTTPQKVALADAQKGISMFAQKQINVPLLGVIENMSYFTPDELPDKKYYIFGKDGGKRIAMRHDTAFLGEIPIVQDIREGGDAGVPVVMQEDNPIADSYRTIANELARQVAIRNAYELSLQQEEV